jgi:hypothetical protein
MAALAQTSQYRAQGQELELGRQDPGVKLIRHLVLRRRLGTCVPKNQRLRLNGYGRIFGANTKQTRRIKMGNRPAGGLGSKNVVEKPVRTGVGARAVNTRFVSRVGQSIGNKVTEKRGTLPSPRADVYEGASYKPIALGNALVNNIGAGGPGAGRQVFKSGMQGQHGAAVNPGRPAPKGELFPGWGSKR